MITQILLQQTIIMFLLMMLGLLLSRRGMITEQGGRDLSNVLLYAVIPCVILPQLHVRVQHGQTACHGRFRLLSR